MIYPKVRQSPLGVAKHYDELDVFYRGLWGEHLHHGLWKSGRETSQEAAKQLVELVAQSAKINQGSKVCDIGCGYGATSRLLTEKYHAHVVGLTISQAQYKYAQSIHPDAQNPTYILRDWLSNGLPSASFDATISIESSEHMVDKPKFFREAYRVLRPKGRIVVCAWLAHHDPSEFAVRNLLEPICSEGRLPSLGTIEDYNHMLTMAGFQNICHRDLTAQVKKTWAVCGWRVAKGFFTNPRLRAFLLSQDSQNRAFAKTVFRLWMAYQTGNMSYGIFTADKL